MPDSPGIIGMHFSECKCHHDNGDDQYHEENHSAWPVEVACALLVDGANGDPVE